MSNKLLATLTAGTIGLVGAATVIGANPAQAAGFSGSYAPSNWTFTNLNADGFVDTSNAPESITLTGGDNLSGAFGLTAYTTAAVNSLVSFNWNYNTQDVDGPFWDPFGFLNNGVFTQLTDPNGSQSQSGTYSTLVKAGDIFGFAVNTLDNIVGPASVTISNFEATQVPEPASVLGLLAFGALGAGAKLKRNKQQVVANSHLN
ncbi:PEP-CTERM sorting domain-containing protein [Microseira sp. BLCC-F43]|jgi:hypothetical protein|uniref:PEP-CTERM sorting domain-containing protein n=1 Tax=Microseira sp. BLCC-F43 TaxID=3153602 RepID=UPI0035B86D8B